MSSWLRVSTGYQPQILLAEHYCTGGGRRTNGRHGLAVQFQQQRTGVGSGDREDGLCGEMAILSRWNFGVERQLAICKDAYARGFGSGDGKIERSGICRSPLTSGQRNRLRSRGLRRNRGRWL